MKHWKNKLIALLAGASALALGGAFVCMGNTPVAHAEEDGETTCYAFYNVGANDDAKAIDTALGLTETKPTSEPGDTVTTGSTLFTSYAEVTSGQYTFAVNAEGTYKVAVAVLADTNTSVTVGSQSAEIPAGTEGKYVAHATASGATVTVTVTGKVCAILIDGEEDVTLMAAEYTDGQIIPYGALLDEVLEDATGYYSNGDIEDVEIEYGDINAATGVNVNFTTIDVTGTVKGTNLTVSRYLTTMPDELIYFINCGSNLEDGKYADTADAYYDYNQTVFDYYGGNLKNDVPDQSTTKGSTTKWGYYTAATYTAPGDATFPYNSLLWTDEATDMGYMLTGLDQGAYRIWIGTLSHWHARSVTITFNDAVVGSETLRINASKGYSVYENVSPDADGKIDLHMQGASTNEPCINFIAVQKMETMVDAVPSKLEGSSIVGMEETSMTVTGVQEGAKLQIYNAARPNQILLEETITAEKIQDDGSYLIEWDTPFTEQGISQFNVVQVTNGGVSGALLVSITDIKDFELLTTPDQDSYTTGTVTVTVKAKADSGIASWSYQLGEYGVVNQFNLDRPHDIAETFTVTQNGDYIVVVTSGLGVTYSETITIGNIDPDSPVITLTPSRSGWETGEYNVTLSVNSIAPVTEYKLYKAGKLLVEAKTAPSTIKFTETGEYLVYVKTAAGQSATSTLCVSDKPTTTLLTRVYARRTLTYTFGNTKDYKIASISVYEVTSTGISRMTIASGNKLDLFEAGTYVATVTTENGTVEMFSITVTKADFKADSTDKLILGIGIGVGVGGVVLAAAAITTFILLKKKKS